MKSVRPSSTARNVLIGVGIGILAIMVLAIFASGSVTSQADGPCAVQTAPAELAMNSESTNGSPPRIACIIERDGKIVSLTRVPLLDA